VASLATAEAVLARGSIPLRRADGGLTVGFPHELGFGAWVFVESPTQLPWRHTGRIFAQSAPRI